MRAILAINHFATPGRDQPASRSPGVKQRRERQVKPGISRQIPIHSFYRTDLIMSAKSAVAQKLLILHKNAGDPERSCAKSNNVYLFSLSTG